MKPVTCVCMCLSYLHDLGRRVVNVVVCLVVLVPLEAGVDAIEVSWLPWPMLVRPLVALLQEGRLNGEARLLIGHTLLGLEFESLLLSVEDIVDL